MTTETYEQQTKDSDTIFSVISNSAENMNEASMMVTMYIMDLNFSRAGISHAVKRLEQHFNGR